MLLLEQTTRAQGRYGSHGMNGSISKYPSENTNPSFSALFPLIISPSIVREGFVLFFLFFLGHSAYVLSYQWFNHELTYLPHSDRPLKNAKTILGL